MKKFLALVFIVAIALHANPIELLGNGSFEKVENDKLLGWSVQGNAGTLEIVNDAHSGKNAARISTINKKACIFFTSYSTPGITKSKSSIPVGKNAKYHVSFWAKGKGSFYFWIPLLNGFKQVGGKRSKTMALTPEYKKYEFVFTADAPEAKGLRLDIFCEGYTETQITIDDASLTFDPDENLGIDPCLQWAKQP